MVAPHATRPQEPPPLSWRPTHSAASSAAALDATRTRSISFRSETRQSRLIPTRANGQPAFGRYLSDPDASLGHAHGLIVLTLAGDRICGITGFNDNSVLPRLGLPRNLPD